MITVSEFVGGALWRLSQEFGRTSFSMAHPLLYKYGEVYCLPSGSHPGVDIGVPVETRLYSPVEGRVIIAGGSPVFQDEVVKGAPQTGQLKIQMDDGAHVIIGHMRSIAVSVGDRVSEKQFIGLSGTSNGPHAHVEIRLPDGGCDPTNFRCVTPIGRVLGDEPDSEEVRLFRVDVPFLSARDQPSMTAATAGDYHAGEIAPCNRSVVLAEEVEPGERAWGHLAGGHFAGKWIFLGFTTEVRPGADDVRYFVVLSDIRNARIEPDPTSPIVGSNQRGAVLPIIEIVNRDGEQWGRLASGPFQNRWSFLGSEEFSIELR
jgi:Peptidase family M23